MTKKNFRFMSALLPLLVACSGHPAGSSPPPEVVVPQSPWVVVRSVEALPLFEVPARVLASPTAAAEVVPPFRARVLRIHVRAGQHVGVGVPIIDVIVPEVMRASSAYVAAGTRAAAYSKHKAQLDALRGEGLVRLADLADVETRLAEALADQQAALGTLRSADLAGSDAARLLQGAGTLTLRSPIAGMVTELRVSIGETHENTDLPLAHIVGTGEVQIEARLSHAMPAAARADFVTPDGQRLPLRLVSTAPMVDPRDGTTLSWFVPAPDAALPQGLSGKVQFHLPAGISDAAAVPTRALFLDGAKTYVRRRSDGERRIAVTVLATSGADAVVRGPLRPGDEVAADAALATEATP